MTVASTDSVLRIPASPLAFNSPDEATKWNKSYFENREHESLPLFFEKLSEDDQNWRGYGDHKGIKAVVLTYSSIHTDLVPLVSKFCEKGSLKVGLAFEGFSFFLGTQHWYF